MTGHPTPVTMPCPRGCDHQLAPNTLCPHCGHQLTTAEQRHLEQRDRVRAAIARTRAEWETHKATHPTNTTTTRRTT